MASPSTKTSTSTKGRTSHLELSKSLLETLHEGGLLSGTPQEAELFLTENKFGPFKPKGASKAASAFGMWQKAQTFEEGTKTADRAALWKAESEEEKSRFQELANAKNAEDGKEVIKKESEGLHTSGWTLHQQSLKGTGLTRDEIKEAWASKSASEKAEMNAQAKANNLAKAIELAGAKSLPPVKVPAKAKTKTPTKPKKEKTEKSKKSKKDKEAEAKKEAQKLAELAALKEKEEESDWEEESDEE